MRMRSRSAAQRRTAASARARAPRHPSDSLTRATAPQSRPLQSRAALCSFNDFNSFVIEDTREQMQSQVREAPPRASEAPEESRSPSFKEQLGMVLLEHARSG